MRSRRWSVSTVSTACSDQDRFDCQATGGVLPVDPIGEGTFPSFGPVTTQSWSIQHEVKGTSPRRGLNTLSMNTLGSLGSSGQCHQGNGGAFTEANLSSSKSTLVRSFLTTSVQPPISRSISAQETRDVATSAVHRLLHSSLLSRYYFRKWMFLRQRMTALKRCKRMKKAATITLARRHLVAWMRYLFKNQQSRTAVALQEGFHLTCRYRVYKRWFAWTQRNIWVHRVGQNLQSIRKVAELSLRYNFLRKWRAYPSFSQDKVLVRHRLAAHIRIAIVRRCMQELRRNSFRAHQRRLLVPVLKRQNERLLLGSFLQRWQRNQRCMTTTLDNEQSGFLQVLRVYWAKWMLRRRILAKLSLQVMWGERQVLARHYKKWSRKLIQSVHLMRLNQSCQIRILSAFYRRWCKSSALDRMMRAKGRSGKRTDASSVAIGAILGHSNLHRDPSRDEDDEPGAPFQTFEERLAMAEGEQTIFLQPRGEVASLEPVLELAERTSSTLLDDLASGASFEGETVEEVLMPRARFTLRSASVKTTQSNENQQQKLRDPSNTFGQPSTRPSAISLTGRAESTTTTQSGSEFGGGRASWGGSSCSSAWEDNPSSLLLNKLAYDLTDASGPTTRRSQSGDDGNKPNAERRVRKLDF